MTNTTFAVGGDIEVRRLGFGAMRITGPGIWGAPRDRAAARALLRRAVDLGVQLIDTADAYGPGVSEELIAEALFPYDGLLIATKGGYERTGPSGESATGQLTGWTPNGRPHHLRSACEASLRRLRLDRIDLYQLHTPTHSSPTKSRSVHSASCEAREKSGTSASPTSRQSSSPSPEPSPTSQPCRTASTSPTATGTTCSPSASGTRSDSFPTAPSALGTTRHAGRSSRQPPPGTALTPARSPSPGCSQSLPSHCPSPAPQHPRTSKTTSQRPRSNSKKAR